MSSAVSAFNKDAGARQQRRVQFERRVFGGGTDKGDGAVFDVRQESVLLALIEAVHFVDEQDGAAGVAILPRPLDRPRISLIPEVTAEIRSTSA